MLASVIVLPCLLVAVWLVVQYALAIHVRHGAQAAAQDAALAGATSSADPHTIASSLMASLGDAAHDVVVSVEDDGEWVTVTVSADVLQVVPVGSFHVSESASAPVEQFEPEDERP